MLTPQEFKRLQTLAALSLTDQETEKLSVQLQTIVQFLGKLQNIPEKSGLTALVQDHTLQTNSGTRDFPDNHNLFINVSGEKIGNTIVISSVVDN